MSNRIKRHQTMPRINAVWQAGKAICDELGISLVTDWWESMRNKPRIQITGGLAMLNELKRKFRDSTQRFVPFFYPIIGMWVPYDRWTDRVPQGYMRGVREEWKCMEICSKLENE